MSTTATPINAQSLAALEAAIVKGVVNVTYAGGSVTYRSLDDMLRLRDVMRRELGFEKRRARPRRGVVRL